MESKKGSEFYTYSHTSWCSRVGVGCIYLFNQAMAADSMFPIRAYETSIASIDLPRRSGSNVLTKKKDLPTYAIIWNVVAVL